MATAAIACPRRYDRGGYVAGGSGRRFFSQMVMTDGVCDERCRGSDLSEAAGVGWRYGVGVDAEDDEDDDGCEPVIGGVSGKAVVVELGHVRGSTPKVDRDPG